jgi:hypothetical protein
MEKLPRRRARDLRRLLLARISHHVATATAHLRTLTRDFGVRLLDVPRGTPPGPNPEIPRQSTNLRRLATRRGGICGLALLLLTPAAASAEIDIVGTWHVLVHYTDDNTSHPDEMRWSDRIWVFETKGSGLRWTEYPIVVFSDESGRFEHLGTSHARRVVAAWEPSEAQFAQILEGLEVNDRGKKKKSLHAEDGGWRTRSRARPMSASILSYAEHWSVEGSPDYPVFRQEDQLGAERTETLEGVTLHTTTYVDPTGNVLRGTYERDGSRHGTFRMVRAGSVTGVKGSGKTQSERLRDAWWKNYSKTMSAEDRAVVSKQIRSSVENHMRSEGLDPSQHQEAVENLSKKIEVEMFEKGRTIEDVRRMLEDGTLTLDRAVVSKQIRSSVEKHMRSKGLDPSQHQEAVESLCKKIEIEIFEKGRKIEEIGRMLEDGTLTP